MYAHTQAHLLDCRYREIQCTQCGQLIPCAKLENHERNECPMRPSVCEYCLSKVPVEQLEVCVCVIIIYKHNTDDGRSTIRHTSRGFAQNI